MDNTQKQILGYLLMALITAAIGYVTGKLQLWFTDPSLLVALGFILTTVLISARKWIKYTFGLTDDDLPGELPEEQAELLQKAVNGLTQTQLLHEELVEAKEKEIEALKAELSALSGEIKEIEET